LSSPGYKLRQGIGNNGSSLLNECMTLEESKLERVKASSSYSISHVYYRVILPIKAKLFSLTLEQESNLDLYRTHIALCAEVDKVKSAFRAYRAAQETVDNTPLESATERKEARKEAQAAGYELLERYDDLIKLAIEQAEDHELDKNQYLDDIQNELSKDYILQTINQIRVRSPIERSVLDFKNVDITYVHGLYRSLVTNFVAHVDAAKCASGGRESSTEISKAFIQGLASIPELAEGETLSDLYDSLNDPELVKHHQIAQMQNIEDHFRKQLTVLMNKKEDIRSEELASIHCHGVNLLSVLPHLTVEKLNALKKVNKEQKEAVAALLKVHSEFEQTPQAQDQRYSYQDIEAFFGDIGKKMEDVLTDARDDVTQFNTVVGRFARKTLSMGELIRTESNELAAIEEKYKKYHETLNECEIVIEQANEEILRLNRVIKDQDTALQKMEVNIDKLDRDFKKFSNTVDSSDQQRIAEEKKRYDIERSRQNDLIEKLKLEIETSKRKKINELCKLGNAKTRLNPLKDKVAETGEQAMQANYRRARIVAPIMSLSAEEVAQIAKYFGVEKPSSTRSRMTQQLSKTKEAIAKVKEETYAPHKALIKGWIALLKDQPFTMKNGEFGMNDNLFGEEVQQSIQAQIAVNIAIARDVTLAVAKEVVDQKDKHYQSQQGSEKKMTHMQKRMAQRTLPLASKLNTARFNQNGVLKTIEERIEALSSPVASTSAPRRVQDQRLSSEPANLSDDAEEECDAGIHDVGTWYKEADRNILRVSEDTSPLLRDESNFSDDE